MKTKLIVASIVVSVVAFHGHLVSAQTSAPPVMSTSPATLEDKMAMYNATVEDRTVKIMQALNLSDSVKSNHVHDAISAHYHALRARDEAIDDELVAFSPGSPEWRAQRVAMFPQMSQPLHDRFIATLSNDLTPDQVEMVKDKMTYGKVQFTYSAYCSIIPNLTDEEKAKILDLLKQAREVAIDGGNSVEKAAIFKQYKDQINAYLGTHGHDVAKETQEWTDRQKQATK